MKISYRNREIEGIPSDVYNNPEIEELNLSKNWISDLSKIENLQKLRVLNIWDNKISDLNPLKRLTNLEELRISNNNIIDISPLSELKKLKELRLSNNNIIDLSPLKKLNKLRKLSLCGNKIECFPRFLLDLNIPVFWESWGKKEGIFIEDNPIQNIPIETLRQGHDAIISYINHLEEQGVVELHNVRLIILGEAGVGKTTFCRKFLKRDSILAKEKTRGIDIAEYNFYSAKDVKINVTLWDFGGQEVYHQTHQLFLSPNAFYILIVDSRRNNNLYYWLELINLYSSNPILIIVNKGDVHHLRLNENEIISSFPNVLKFYYTSFKEDNFKLTRREIHTAIESLPNLSISLPRKWNDIKESLTKLSKQSPYLSIEEFDKLCEKYNLVTWEVKESLLKYLNNSGEIIYYDDLLLNDIIFLDLNWVLDSIYKLLNNNSIIQNQGRFNEKILTLIWADDNYHNIRNKLILILMKFEICYQTNQSSNDSKYIIPQLLPVEKPKYISKPENNKGMVFQYDFMPSNIFSRLLVVIQKIAIKIIHIWRQGIIFKYKDEEVCVEQATLEKKISINANTHQTDILSVLKGELNKLHETFQNIKVKTFIPCICSTCSKIQSPYLYDYEHVLKFKKRFIEGFSGNL